MYCIQPKNHYICPKQGTSAKIKTLDELALNINTFFFGYGAKRIRTADPLNAIEVLYQLSYNPVMRILR